MLISRWSKSNFINYKISITILENAQKKLIFIILFLFFIGFYLASKTNNIFTESRFSFLDELLIDNGFIVKNIKILGVNHLEKEDIIKIISTHNNVNIFSINIKNIYREILNNTWIQKAFIQIIYPNTIKISITEKKPIAIWQNRYGNSLITKSGDVIFEKNLEKFKSTLPIIIGENAHKNVNLILNILNSNKYFAKNIWSLTFVNERRWDVHFMQGLTIRLPSKNIKKAWEKVMYLDQKFKILNIGLTEIDLRNPNQVLGKINIDKNLIFKKKNS